MIDARTACDRMETHNTYKADSMNSTTNTYCRKWFKQWPYPQQHNDQYQWWNVRDKLNNKMNKILHKHILYMYKCQMMEYNHILCTWVFPPVVSCIADRDNEPVLTKHEKNEVTTFVIPWAKNSCNRQKIILSCTYTQRRVNSITDWAHDSMALKWSPFKKEQNLCEYSITMGYITENQYSGLSVWITDGPLNSYKSHTVVYITIIQLPGWVQQCSHVC